MDLTEVVKNCIFSHIDKLTNQCSGCPKILECEEQNNDNGTGNTARYCKNLIIAAIKGESDFKWPF